MQVRAIFEAALDAEKETGKKIIPEVMIPLIMEVEEFVFLKKKIEKVAEEVSKKRKKKVKYLIGTMIELPMAAFIS
jgi:pyruvate,orthophosphate dikinase